MSKLAENKKTKKKKKNAPEVREEGDEKLPPPPLPAYTIKELRDVYASYMQKDEEDGGLPVGSLVTWKPELVDKVIPRDGHRAVVIEVLRAPARPKGDVVSGHGFDREPLDIVLGAIHTDDRMYTYHYDARRFCKWKGPLSAEDKDLVSRAQRLLETRAAPFKVGDLAVWKLGLANRTMPKYDRPALVIDVLDAPVIVDEKDPASNAFMERVDVVLLAEAERGRFITLVVDGRRIDKFE
jgi:hypothetical protein